MTTLHGLSATLGKIHNGQPAMPQKHRYPVAKFNDTATIRTAVCQSVKGALKIAAFVRCADLSEYAAHERTPPLSSLGESKHPEQPEEGTGEPVSKSPVS
jgi:hypothetical protein